MLNDSATLTAMPDVAVFRFNEQIVRDGNLHQRWPCEGDDALEIGATLGDGREALCAVVALSSNTGAPIDLLFAEVRSTAAWHRVRNVAVSAGMDEDEASLWADTLCTGKVG